MWAPEWFMDLLNFFMAFKPIEMNWFPINILVIGERSREVAYVEIAMEIMKQIDTANELMKIWFRLL